MKPSTPLTFDRFLPPCRRRGATLIETLIALAVLMVGVVAIVNYFPSTLNASYDAVHVSQGALLAQMKAEEIRRDNDFPAGDLLDEIRSRSTETEPIPFPIAPHLSYSFAGRSAYAPDDAPGTATVIVRYSADFRPSRDIVYELQF